MRHLAQDDGACIVAAPSVHEACLKADGSDILAIYFGKPLLSNCDNPQEENACWSVWSEKALISPKNALPSKFQSKATGINGASDRDGINSGIAVRLAGSGEGQTAVAKSLAVPWPSDSVFLRNASRNPLFAAASLLVQGNDVARES